jgi:hypothetical protein
VIAVTPKRKIYVKSTTREMFRPKASRFFVEELMGTCAGSREVMTSPELRGTSSGMLKVTRGQWNRKDPIPWAANDDYFTSRMARELKMFPYGRNIGVVVSAVMDKDHQEAL